jgi:hypothetical protein
MPGPLTQLRARKGLRRLQLTEMAADLGHRLLLLVLLVLVLGLALRAAGA